MKLVPTFGITLLFMFISISCIEIPNYNKEVFGFLYPCNKSLWEKIYWNKLTTIVLVGEDAIQKSLVKEAHDQGVRVLLSITYHKRRLADLDYQKRWIKRKLELIKKHDLDGLNLHFEDAIDKDAVEVKLLNNLVKSLASNLKQQFPNARLAFDAPWASVNAIGTAVDGRNYDYLTIYDVVDHFIVFSFHVSSQQFIGNEYQDDQCFAHPTSGVYKSAGGIISWIHFVESNGSTLPTLSPLGLTTVPKNKDVLPRPTNKFIYLQPWWGIDYVCTEYDQFNRCILPAANYRGNNCTDRAGTMKTYSEIADLLNTKGWWNYDPHSLSGYVEYWLDGERHQLWFDDINALLIKYNFVDEFQVGGTGVYALNFADYNNATTLEELYSALPSYKTQQLRQQNSGATWLY